MILSEAQITEFEALARPMLKFLNDNFHPHVTVEITPTTAQLFEGVCGIGEVMDYVHD